MRRRNEKFPDNGFEAWGGYMQAKISKLEEQFCNRVDNEEALSDIFNGVSIYVNGFTIPPADELKGLMYKHGGTYHTYQRNEDYIIASNLPDTKVKNMSLARVVRPEWITDSIANYKLLDYREYLLYKNSRNQMQLNFKKVLKDENSVKEITCNTLNDLKLNSADINYDQTSLIKLSPNLKPVDVTEHNTSTQNNNGIMNPLKQNQVQVTKTAADPNFISEFYNNSRLHHISQLGACFKQHVNELRENSNFLFPAREELKEKILAVESLHHLSPLYFEKNKIIMHIDMDCFFVSVGLRNRPDLRGKPVAVTHSKGGQGRPKRDGVDRATEFNLYKQKQAKKLGKATGQNEEDIGFESRVDNIADEDDKYGSMSEIASCSYEARAKGVSNGMFMGAALRLCPDLLTIPYDFEGYKEVAYTLYNTIAKYTLDIEAVSCDEMYVDCTDLLKEMKISAQDFATVLRNEIRSKTGCPCSTGFGGNRLQARLATKKAKPDGQFFLTEDLVEDFMSNIRLKDLPGVGRQIAHKLEFLGHTTCGSLQSLNLATLKSHLGNKTGAQIFDQCRGRDSNALTFYTVRKSVSAEVNYGIRFENINQCYEFLKQLSAEVHSRMQQFKVLGKCITLKLMVRAEDAPVETAKFMGHGYCNVINKSTSLNTPTNDVDVITKEVICLCKKQNIDPKEMRGIGIQLTKLESINSKTNKGAINKFILNKFNKTVSKDNGSIPDLVRDLIKTENSFQPEITTQKKPATPLKSNINMSPPKHKSPIILVKSPTGKRRGRPPKSLRSQPSSSKNLMNKFLHGQISRDTPFKNPMVKDFVYEEIKPKIHNPTLREVIHKEVEPKIEKDHGLLGLPWRHVKELLRAWLESGQTPLPCDINMLVVYLQEMVVDKNIEKLHVLVNFLRRMTKELGSHEWTEVYNHVLEQVQNAMIAVYGKRLFIFD